MVCFELGPNCRRSVWLPETKIGSLHFLSVDFVAMDDRVEVAYVYHKMATKRE